MMESVPVAQFTLLAGEALPHENVPSVASFAACAGDEVTPIPASSKKNETRIAKFLTALSLLMTFSFLLFKNSNLQKCSAL
jgi:hypothetical protein